MGIRTIRNLDEKLYRQFKARAVAAGRPVGALLADAMRAYLARPAASARRGSLSDLRPESYPRGNERLSEEIDEILYGAGSR